MTNKHPIDNISCIIPVYNEGKRIARVLKTVQYHPLIAEVIVVNDGSTDNTEIVIRQFSGIKIISYKKNMGKSYAVMSGIKIAKNNLIMLLDGDLIGLTRKNLTELIMPVQEKKVDVAISLRGNAFLPLKIIGVDFLSGERVFQKNLIPDNNYLKKLPSFAIESYINSKIIKNRNTIKVIPWNNVVHPVKRHKYGSLIKAIKEEVITFTHISIITGGIFGMFDQIFQLMLLKR